MKNYLVGGAVRDKILGIESADNDWVVVGSTPQQMLDDGFKQVGKDFPVFLHPETKEEYALARTERKIGKGYTGFSTEYASNVTLTEDLARRDLTINAIAQDEKNLIIDPYNGERDIKDKVLRHVTHAFVEDPLRVLRVARFKARFHHLGFSIAPETNVLMKQIAASGELLEIAPERIWVETAKALMEKSPEQYFYALRSCDALGVVFPEIERLFGVPQRADYHPEIDTGIHTMMVLSQAAAMNTSSEVRFASLVHDLGKADTPKIILPKHIGHEKRSITRVKEICARLRVPVNHTQLALLVAEFHTQCHQAFELKATTVLKLLEHIDAYRRPSRFEAFLLACEADSKGRKDFEDSEYPQADYLRRVYEVTSRVDAKTLVTEGYKGIEINNQLKKLRVEAIKKLQSNEKHE